ncbi:MAG TPA: hydroxyacid dehydrogenase [Pseudonocardiaceae bacterium]|nr:hydroxyacid dehydrogenase [Pseudonocardiaceae bacterium]
MNVVLAMAEHLPPLLFGPAERDALGLDFDAVLTEFDSARAKAALAEAEVLITGWECPPIDVADVPKLRAVVHAAGSVRGHVGPEVFARGIMVSSAAWANALPVAEYTVAMILLAGKDTFAIARRYRETRTRIDLVTDYPNIGNFGRTVGIVGASLVGRGVLRLLAPFDLELLVNDPYLSTTDAEELGAELVGLDELFRRSQVLSIHAPALPETRGMVDSARLALLPDGATLINTARGSLVDQDALENELRTGRISAVLDVTEPEVLSTGSALWDLPNLVITPHLAGSVGTELRRMGASAVAEVLRVVAGQPLRHEVRAAALATLA